MKRFTVLLVLLLIFNCYPQADLTLTLYFFDNSPPGYLGSNYVQFGLDSTATDGVDEHLGEWSYPPDGCGCFGWCLCAVFNIPPTYVDNGYMRDFRFGVLPYNLQTNHVIRFYETSAATELYLAWSLPTGVTGLLKDPLGGVYINVTMADSNVYQIPSNAFGWLHTLLMTITYNNVVPVELTSFTASVLQNEKVVQLNWLTATETNNSGFEIQRQVSSRQSSIGNLPNGEANWEAIGFIPGFSTTTEPKSYSFVDENVSTGKYRYRLKQNDFDGSFEYSSEIEVEVDFAPKEFMLYQNYPNPFNPNTIIKFTVPNVETNHDASLQMVTLKVYDLLGNKVATLVNEEKEPGVYEVEFNPESGIRNPASGIYFYQLKAGQYSATKKMILLR